jgi:hypothetical protein
MCALPRQPHHPIIRVADAIFPGTSGDRSLKDKAYLAALLLINMAGVRQNGCQRRIPSSCKTPSGSVSEASIDPRLPALKHVDKLFPVKVHFDNNGNAHAHTYLSAILSRMITRAWYDCISEHGHAASCIFLKN